MSTSDTQYLLNNLLTVLFSKIYVPTDFHGRVKCVKSMQDNDVTGVVDSLTDFQVQSATVDYQIETTNDELTKIYNEWLEKTNQVYNGKIPSGIRALSEEYYKERWKYSSFPILNIEKWEPDPKSKLILPSKMYFLDGGSVYAHDKDPDGEGLSLDQYDYYLGKSKKANLKLGNSTIITKANGRWIDKYPNPFLVKRGVYFNWRIIEALKRNEIDVLDQVIPYMIHIKKNTERLAIDKKVNYNDDKLKEVIEKFEKLFQDAENSKYDATKKNTPIRASQFDEEIKHLIPDLEALFKASLFNVAEKNILSGMGFIDIVDGATSTRRESILNPKPFIQEVESGVEGFKQILKDLVLKIQEKNKDHSKYMNVSYKITSTPIKGFMTDKFKERIRQLWDRGQLSSQTAIEIIGEGHINPKVEIQRREYEARTGIDLVLYPHLTENREDKGFDVANPDEDNEEQPDSKTDKVEKKNFDKASLYNPLDEEMELIGSPYASVQDLPASVTKRIQGIEKRRAWLAIFNSAYNYYMGKFGDKKRAESLAFATANSKYKYAKSKKKKSAPKQPDKAQLEKDSVDKEIKQKQNSLLDKLLNRKDKE